TSIVLACLDSPNLNYSNRPVRTRMPGGVGGASQHAGCPYPDFGSGFHPLRMLTRIRMILVYILEYFLYNNFHS
ncbi:MAG: hypothetical protein AB1437_25140, partial [Pseudomonadota bacterium]